MNNMKQLVNTWMVHNDRPEKVQTLWKITDKESLINQKNQSAVSILYALLTKAIDLSINKKMNQGI